MRTSRACLIMALCCSAGGRAAPAGQILIGPGERWEHRAPSLAPGDELVLMPGRHSGATLGDLAGTGSKPLVIRGLSVDQPAIIEADRAGLHLEGVRHLVIRDLVIEGAEIAGITLVPPRGHADAAEPWPAHITLRNVTVRGTGPTGQRHAVHVAHLRHVVIEQCTLDGWGGAAIDLTACSDVEVKGCRLTGRAGFSQAAGIQVRGGSSSVRISDCSIVDAGPWPLVIGGEDDASLSMIGTSDDARGAISAVPSKPLAASVRVTRCFISGASGSIRCMSVDECRLQNLTIAGAGPCVLSLDHAPVEEVLLPSRGIVFSSNLVVWEPGALHEAVRTGPRAVADAVSWEANLWWSAEPTERRAELVKLPGKALFPQVLDIDPQLDETGAPQAPEAGLYGAQGP